MNNEASAQLNFGILPAQNKSVRQESNNLNDKMSKISYHNFNWKSSEKALSFYNSGNYERFGTKESGKAEVEGPRGAACEAGAIFRSGVWLPKKEYSLGFISLFFNYLK